jgi:DNA repair protein SbcC/Rad50
MKPEAYDLVKASTDTVVAEHERQPFDAIVISGDWWDGAIMDTARAMFAEFLDLIRRLADCAPVLGIYGTPSHDPEGSLEVFETLQAKHSIVILRPGKAYYLNSLGGVHDGAADENDKLLLFGVPEPSKKWLLANGGATGKDESDSMVRQAMRALLLGLGGMRKEHSELPCLLLYHGQVSGARSGTGYEAGSGIMVSRDDLAAVGFDYGALGDIHEPQKIADLQAYYPGSIYPKNFGETHKAGCNVVEIAPVPATETEEEFDLFKASGAPSTGFLAKVSRLDFPHPQRVKLARKPDDGIAYNTLDLEGKLVWEEWTASREWAAGFDAESELSGLIQGSGALPGSRVTLSVLPTETVRAGEITEKKTLRDKVKVWGEASETTIPESALAKADELEREGTAQGGTSGACIRIDRLILRGAIGIWKKSHKDEIDLNLEAIGPGVVAFASPNGAGKTTILENLHPWPSMLTRDGTLKDHFRLKDSFRDLYFTDERTGWKYRALINIRADIASGSAEYFLFCDKGQGYEHLPGIDGRLKPYEEAVSALFGSLEMYLQTAFVTQRPTKYAPELSQATQGQRKTLFGELAGIDYLERYREAAKARGDALEGDLVRLDATIEAASDVEALIEAAKRSIEDSGLKERASLLDAQNAERDGKQLAAERDLLAARVADLDRKTSRKGDLEREIAALLGEVKKIEVEVEGFQEAAKGRGAAEDELAKAEALGKEADALKAEKAKIDEADRKASEEFQRIQSAVLTRQNAARASLDEKNRAYARVDRELGIARAKLSEPIKETCPTCGQLLPEADRTRLETARHEIEVQVASLTDSLKALGHEVDVAEATVGAVVFPVPPVATPFPGASRLHEIERALDWLDPEAARETIRKADEAAVRIEEAGKRKTERVVQMRKYEDERDALGCEIAAEYGTRETLAAKDRELDTTRERYTAAKGAASAAHAFGEAAKRNLEDAEKRAAARKEAETKRAAVQAELSDWRLLERAVGPNGVQALELDALSPSIAAVSNKLLAEAYGSRYQIEFRTTRIAGTGKKTKQVEDFEIVILDTETGDEQTIDSLSGGEAVWIRKALYSGFAIIRAKNTGTRFQTSFLDEADGALDPESRMMYLRMLEAEHKESGRFQTIIVTHSTELQSMVERTINVAELGPREEKKEAVAA